MLGILVSIEGRGLRVRIDTRSKKEKNMIPVLQIKGNKIIGEFPSISSAQRVTGIRNISECLSGNRRTAGGYKWSRAEQKEMTND